MFPPFLRSTFWSAKETPAPSQQWPKIAALLTLTITATALPVQVSLRGIYSSSTASERDPALDQTFFATPLTVTVEPLGIWLNKRIVASPLIVEVGFAPSAGETTPGSQAPGLLQNLLVMASPLEVWIDLNTALSIRVGRDVYPPAVPAALLRGPVLVTAPATKKNWVKWANIGVLDFTILKDNLAGERPLPMKGSIYALKMLDKKVVAYGENGVAVLPLAGNTYGLEILSHIGLRSKQAVTGNGALPVETVHYFLDKQAQLWQLGQGLQFLDYSEYLSELVTPVLSYDPQEQLLYLCDGTRGFVYDPATKSLGRGSANISGIGVQDGTKYITAPATITLPLLAVTTDIYDFGTRRAKTIESVEVGVDTSATVQIAIEYRQKIGAAFVATNFYTIDNRGVKPLACYGYEFRFLLKALSTGWNHLDYLRVNGHVHDH